MNTSSHSSHTCNICNKSYSSRQNLWRHKQTHTKDTCKSNVSKLDNIPIIVSHKTTVLDLQKASNVINEKPGYSCDFCCKVYMHRQSKYKHQSKCKIKINENILLKNELLEKENQNNIKTIDNLKKQLDDFKKVLMEVMNKNCKVHLVLKNHEAFNKVKRRSQKRFKKLTNS